MFRCPSLTFLAALHPPSPAGSCHLDSAGINRESTSRHTASCVHLVNCTDCAHSVNSLYCLHSLGSIYSLSWLPSQCSLSRESCEA